jgi:hypothetical protein
MEALKWKFGARRTLRTNSFQSSADCFRNIFSWQHIGHDLRKDKSVKFGHDGKSGKVKFTPPQTGKDVGKDNEEIFGLLVKLEKVIPPKLLKRTVSTTSRDLPTCVMSLKTLRPPED